MPILLYFAPSGRGFGLINALVHSTRTAHGMPLSDSEKVAGAVTRQSLCQRRRHARLKSDAQIRPPGLNFSSWSLSWAWVQKTRSDDRVCAAFVRYFDASPQKLDEIAAGPSKANRAS